MKYGPNTAQVEALIDQAKAMTPEQAETIRSACDAARGTAVWTAARYTARVTSLTTGRVAVLSASRDACRAAFRTSPGFRAARDTAWGAAWDTVLALVVRDQITEEHFRILYGPWGSVFGEPK